MPRETASSSLPPVSTVSVRLPMTIAVPVSWHIGSTPPAETQAFCSRSVATNRSFGDASGSSTIDAQLGQVRRPQQVLDVVHRLAHDRGDGGGVDLEEGAAPELRSFDEAARRKIEPPVGGVVGAQGQDIRVVERHGRDGTRRARQVPVTWVGRPDRPPTGPTSRGSRVRMRARSRGSRWCTFTLRGTSVNREHSRNDGCACSRKPPTCREGPRKGSNTDRELACGCSAIRVVRAHAPSTMLGCVGVVTAACFRRNGRITSRSAM